MKEIEDLPWAPRWWRDYMTDCLQFIAERFGSYRRCEPLISRLLAASEEKRIVDFGSGGGGPLPSMYGRLRADAPELQIVLTDLFPNREAFAKYEQTSGSLIGGVFEPVDATQPPPHLRGVRTMFTSFHHLSRQQATEVLRRAAVDKAPLGIFEVTAPTVRHIVAILLIPFAILFFTPFLRPLSAGRLISTYVIPLVPLGCLWDGLISLFRTRSVKELSELADVSGSPQYRFEVGTFKVAGILRGTYLLGFPLATPPRAG